MFNVPNFRYRCLDPFELLKNMISRCDGTALFYRNPDQSFSFLTGFSRECDPIFERYSGPDADLEGMQIGSFRFFLYKSAECIGTVNRSIVAVMDIRLPEFEEMLRERGGG